MGGGYIHWQTLAACPTVPIKMNGDVYALKQQLIFLQTCSFVLLLPSTIAIIRKLDAALSNPSCSLPVLLYRKLMTHRLRSNGRRYMQPLPPVTCRFWTRVWREDWQQQVTQRGDGDSIHLGVFTQQQSQKN